MRVTYRSTKAIPKEQLLKLYRAVRWSAAKRPRHLVRAIARSHSVITAWSGGSLVGLGNAISDGALVVYYPHLVVLPEYQRQGIGRAIMKRLIRRYRGFHQHMLVAESKAVVFYRTCGLARAGKTIPMWIFKGAEHG